MFEKQIKTRSGRWRSILAAMRIRPESLIATGTFSAVYDNHDGTVTKFTSDDIWVDYALDCAHLPNAVRPLHVCAHAVLYEQHRLSIALLPKYTAVKPNSQDGRFASVLRKVRAQEQERLLMELRLGGDSKWLQAPAAELLDRIRHSVAASHPQREGDIATLIGLAKFIRKHRFARLIGVDLHHQNFMSERCGRLVLSDPLVLTAPQLVLDNHPINTKG